MMIERLLVGAILAACLAGLYLTSTGQSTAEQERALYCKMVDAWHDTNGKAGWPPYDGDCDND